MSNFFFVKIKLMSINWLKVIKHLSAKAKCEIGKDHKLQVSLQGVEVGIQALEVNSAMASHTLSQASQSVINSFQLELQSCLF